MFKEFKAFIAQGNVVDLAVAVIIGGAFGAIVSSLVEDIIMPLAGIIMGGVSFENLAIEVGDAVLTYGAFIQSIVDFLIIAFFIFLALRFVLRKDMSVPEEEEVDPQEQLLTEIRDLLKEQQK
ncbi:MAG TPA: large conductance mechanosensitive channel protein MscL [Pseudogracilibacillus sp.]|nr:large conductance mechanosensitive channel protein MscL [Pseudogracilibacillus sp.]